MGDGRPGPESEKDTQQRQTRAEFGVIPAVPGTHLNTAQDRITGKGSYFGKLAIPGGMHQEVSRSTRDALPGMILSGSDPATQQEMKERLTGPRMFAYSGPAAFTNSWNLEYFVATIAGHWAASKFNLAPPMGTAAVSHITTKFERALNTLAKPIAHPLVRFVKGVGLAYFWNTYTEHAYVESQQNDWANSNSWGHCIAGNVLPYIRPNPISGSLVGLSMYYRWFPSIANFYSLHKWNIAKNELLITEKAVELAKSMSPLSNAAKAAESNLVAAKQAEAAAKTRYQMAKGSGGRPIGFPIFLAALGTEAVYNSFRADDTKDSLRQAWDKDKSQRTKISMNVLFDELCKLSRVKPSHLKAQLTNEQNNDYADDLALGHRRKALLAAAFGITELERGSLVRVSSRDEAAKWDSNATFLRTGTLDLGGIARDHLIETRKNIRAAGGGLDEVDQKAKEALDLIYGQHNIAQIFRSLVVIDNNGRINVLTRDDSIVPYSSLLSMYNATFRHETAQLLAKERRLPDAERDYQRMAKACRDVAFFGLVVATVRDGTINNNQIFNEAMNWLDLAMQQKGQENHPDARQIKQLGTELRARLGLTREASKDPLEDKDLKEAQLRSLRGVEREENSAADTQKTSRSVHMHHFRKQK